MMMMIMIMVNNNNNDNDNKNRLQLERSNREYSEKEKEAVEMKYHDLLQLHQCMKDEFDSLKVSTHLHTFLLIIIISYYY